MSNTKDKIMTAARELFEKNGFDAATTKQIAALAGVSEVTLFRHFETKRNLFEQTVHSSLHPYKLQEYLKNGVKHDLDEDLRHIAYNIMETFEQNLPMLKMVFKDKMRGSESKMQMKRHEHGAMGDLRKYFEEMHSLGLMKVDPKMAMKFFNTNITGFFMKDLFRNEGFNSNKEYFAWMLDRVIAVLKG